MALSTADLKALLSTRNLTPLAQFGQNFMVDSAQAEFLSSLVPDHIKTVLEIGPGLGAVTELLLKRDIHVSAIEIDRGLCTYLQETLTPTGKFTLLPGDALDILPTLEPFAQVIGAIPYNISTPLLVTLALWPTPPEQIVFTTQREMADRIAAVPRTKEYNASTILVQSVFQVEIVRKVPRTAFFPQPKVDSAVIRLTRLEKLPERREKFYELLRGFFQHRRKALPTSITGEQRLRAEELSVGEWLKIHEDRH